MKIDMKLIRSFRPCYDPSKYLPEDFKGTALDILKHIAIPDKDKLWVVLRKEILDVKTLRLFSVECARYDISFLKDQELISKLNSVLEVSTRYANGLATEDERAAAYSAAKSAAYSAANSDSDLAAYSAVNSTAYVAAYAAANSAKVKSLIYLLTKKDV